MKKLFCLFLSVLMLLTMLSCNQSTAPSETTAAETTTEGEPPCEHVFAEATCHEPRTCTLCGATEGLSLHQAAPPPTCTEASVCSICKKMIKRSLGHNYVDRVCTRCHEVNPYLYITCIGDSITRGRYWKLMASYLPDTYSVDGFGVNGATGLAAGLDGNPPVPLAYVDQKEHETAKDSAPDVVVIMLGTNDSKDMNADRIRLDGGEQYKKDMVSLINEYKSLDTKPTIFLALPPVSFRPETGSISNVNIEGLIIPLLLSVAEETGATVIDTHEATKGKSDLFPDGVHPNDAGKDLLAKTVAEAILEEFSETKTPAKTN